MQLGGNAAAVKFVSRSLHTVRELRRGNSGWLLLPGVTLQDRSGLLRDAELLCGRAAVQGRKRRGCGKHESREAQYQNEYETIHADPP